MCPFCTPSHQGDPLTGCTFGSIEPWSYGDSNPGPPDCESGYWALTSTAKDSRMLDEDSETPKRRPSDDMQANPPNNPDVPKVCLSDQWHRRWRLGRFQFGFHLYRHTYPRCSDRWVLQPMFIYDRKSA